MTFVVGFPLSDWGPDLGSFFPSLGFTGRSTQVGALQWGRFLLPRLVFTLVSSAQAGALWLEVCRWVSLEQAGVLLLGTCLVGGWASGFSLVLTGWWPRSGWGPAAGPPAPFSVVTWLCYLTQGGDLR